MGSSSEDPPKLAVGRAEDTKRQWEVADNPHKQEPVRIDDAIESYLMDANARELKPATLYKLEGIFRKQFLSWTQHKGLRYLKEVNVALLP